MNSSNLLSTRKRICLVSMGLLAILLASGALTTSGFSAYAGSGTSNIQSNVNSTAVSNNAQTNTGKVQLMGSTTALSAIGSNVVSNPSGAISQVPNLGRDYSRPTTSQSTSQAPSVGSASISGSGGATSAKGLNAYDSGQSNYIAGFGPLDVEPPDQGLCVGNGYAMDTVNLAIQVYDSSTFQNVSDVTSLAALVGFPVDQQFGVNATAGGGYILSDPRCMYDTGTGHWFISFLYLGGNDTFSSGGNFPLGSNTYGAEFVLASTGTSPLGSYNIYWINVTADSLATNCPCFGDQPLLGADANTLIISTNEYSVFAATNYFNGAQVYLFDKNAMAAGASSLNYVHFNIGLTVNPPDGGGIGCAASGGLYCYYSVDPAVSPTTGSYDTSNSGTAWAMSSLDFTGAGDNRIAVWSFSDTSSISSTPAIVLSHTLYTNLESYVNFGLLVPQAPGPIPDGRLLMSNTGPGGAGCVGACHVGKLASNGDGMWDTVTYAQGALWGAVNTIVNQGKSLSPQHMGVAFWVFNAAGTSISLATQGYISAPGAQLLFPSIGVGPSGNALVAFTITGSSMYPSSGYAWINKTSTGPIGGTVYVSAAGQAPQDGFSEYQLIQYSGSYRPRWGDYTWAIWSGGKVYFSTEYIQSPNCGNAAFLSSGGTCGGTRDPFANWGTSLNSVST